jgi:hypothetical protein
MLDTLFLNPKRKLLQIGLTIRMRRLVLRTAGLAWKKVAPLLKASGTSGHHNNGNYSNYMKAIYALSFQTICIVFLLGSVAPYLIYFDFAQEISQRLRNAQTSLSCSSSSPPS